MGWSKKGNKDEMISDFHDENNTFRDIPTIPLKIS